ncbi:MAG: hypothetical protein A3J70_05250 [Elusimicrobia bacterium RIFCSPHIGHO2_02_FULL_61_10]|nr:MAG: hypothetical protein A2992_02335 [Elusimicrobia bacterium RIFCSPLOWO2_01_FULL_59_12]OGS18397.1 MAG: hypothetical protein A3J70_05250 [Elusimicrobia bacterium RIFCSPHIGHO2_02_FULL_61_10]
MELITILKEAIRQGASDVHIAADSQTMIRVNGELQPLTQIPPLDGATVAAMMGRILTDAQRARFEKELNVDCTFGLDTMRFRMSVTVQRHGMEAVIRMFNNQIPLPEELYLPPAVVGLTELKRGLVLVTGPAGSGKSTTIASLLERINQTRRCKIITVEDPIEFLHASKNSFISQREIGQHAPNFDIAMRNILRQDPDVVLVGEMRDYETIAAAIQIADTGHFVLATLHSLDAPQAVERIVDVFPGHQQQQIRVQLAIILRAVIAQLLLPRMDGNGRVAAFEVMINTQAVATMIRQGRTHEIYSAIEMGSSDGMKSMSRSLTELATKGLIDKRFLPTGQGTAGVTWPGSAGPRSAGSSDA